MPDEQRSISQRARDAAAPGPIPPRRKKGLLWRIWGSVSENNIFLASGGVSYAVLVALFPGLAALVSIYGLVMDPRQIEAQVNALSGMLPAETREMLSQELHQLVSAPSGTLSFGAVAGVLLALWSASRGMSGIMSALNMAYEQKERRGFLEYNATALVLTVGLMVVGIVAITLIAGLPAAAQFIGATALQKWLALIVQWPVLVVLSLLELAVLYRFGPCRARPQWQWISPGAVTATALWLVASFGFTAFVTNVSSYGRTYGSLGGVVVLLTWLYISAFVVLLGAVVNEQTERRGVHTVDDTEPG